MSHNLASKPGETDEPSENDAFVIPLTKLQRRPGNMWETDLVFGPVTDMGVALARVSPNTSMAAHVRLESVMEGVLATADVDYQVEAECARCLEPLEWNDSTSLQELFIYPDTDSRGREIAPTADNDASDEVTVYHVHDDAIDLEEPIRDAIVLDLPLKPLCDENCKGLCPTCGEKLGEDDHNHEVADPRWSALSGLFGENVSNAEHETDSGTES